MWNRLQSVFWIFLSFLILGSGTGIAHAAQHPATGPRAWSTPITAISSHDFSKFAGTWIAHGAFMIISADGNVKFEARTYNWCGSNTPQPCDSIKNNQIFYGYHEHLSLANASGSVAYGNMVASTDSPARPNAAITLTLGPDDTLSYVNNASITLLCGPAAPAGTCGA